jgi:hypothetical protein
MDTSSVAFACAMAGIEAGRAIRDAIHALPLAERARPCASRLKPHGNVTADQIGEDLGVQHLERLSRAIGYRILLILDGTQVMSIGDAKGTECVWAYLDAIDGTIKVAGVRGAASAERLPAANDGGWATAVAFTAPIAKPFENLVVGDFTVAAIVDGNPTRHPAYPAEVMTVPGDAGLETYDVTTADDHRRVYTSSATTLAGSVVYLDGFQAFDRNTALPDDEELAVELYRLLINRHEGGAYDVWRQYANLNALQKMMLGWRDAPVWLESQGVAFLALNENMTNLIPAVPVITGAGGIAIDLDDHLLNERPLHRGRTSIVHVANPAIRRLIVELIARARARVAQSRRR